MGGNLIPIYGAESYLLPPAYSSSRIPSFSLQIRILNLTRPRRRLRQQPTLPTPPVLLARLERLDRRLNLRAQIRAHERGLMGNDGAAAARVVGAVPAHAVEGAVGPPLLEHDADGVGEADRVVGRVGGVAGTYRPRG